MKVKMLGIGWAILLLTPSSLWGRPSSSWEPSPFVDGTANLPPKYYGNDVARFAETLASNSEKDDFETTAQFDARTSDFSKVKPIEQGTLYAFKIWALGSYDADKQAYLFHNSYACKTPTFLEKAPLMLLCRLDVTIGDNGKGYVGQNAFGAATYVTKLRGASVSLALNTVALEESGILGPDDGIGNYEIDYELPVPVDKARSLQGKSIALLFIGRVAKATIVKGQGFYSAPTISHPTDIAMADIGIPFDLTSLVFYVVETGERLKTISVSRGGLNEQANVSPPDPRGNPDSWANSNDYPSNALRNKEEGLVGYTVSVDESGKVSGCEVTRSSGYPELDATTCALITRRGRFNPAMNSRGEPVPGTWTSVTRWEIPR